MADVEKKLTAEHSLDNQHVGPRKKAKEGVVDIGEVFGQWRSIGAARGLLSDADIACFLVQCYENTGLGQLSAPCCTHCHAPLTLSCLRCSPVAASGKCALSPTATGSSTSSLMTMSADSSSLCGEENPGSRNDLDHQPRKCNSGTEVPISLQENEDGFQYQSGKSNISNCTSGCSGSENGEKYLSSAVTNVTEDKSRVIKISREDTDGEEFIRADYSQTKVVSEDQIIVSHRFNEEQVCQISEMTNSEKLGPPETTSLNKQRPEMTSSGELELKCLLCLELFSGAAALTMHMHGHSVGMENHCDKCGAGFILPSVLQLHRRTQHCTESKSISSLQKQNTVHREERGGVSSDKTDIYMDENIQTPKMGHEKLTSSQQDTDIYGGDTDIESEPEADINKGCKQQNSKSVAHLTREQSEDKHVIKHSLLDRSVHLTELPDCGQQSQVDTEVNTDTHKEDRYGCQYCGQTYLSLDSLVVHTRSHYVGTSVNCLKCLKDFHSHDLLSMHHCGGSDTKPVSGSQDGTKMVAAAQVEQHVQTCSRKQQSFRKKKGFGKLLSDNTKPVHVCDICAIKCSSARLLRHHKKTEHKERRKFQCGHCGKELCNMQTLITHERTHTGAKPFQCTECPSTFRSSSNLRAHMRTHTGHTPYLCPQCGRGFKEITHLKRHLVSHSGERPHQCQQCGKAYVHATSLKEHMQSHSSSPKSWVCHQCGKAFVNSKKLKVHLKIHNDKSQGKAKTTNGRRFTCQVCGATYQQASSLSRHKKLHVIGTTPHACLDCGKTFRDKYELKKHGRIHSGLAPHQCLQCPRSFRDASSYKRHVMSHSGLKPHVCSQCSKDYADLKALRHHLQTHTGVRPHTCPSCSKAFFTPWTLRLHLQHHLEGESSPSSTKEKSHICHQCGATYLRASSLVRHQRLHEAAQGQTARYQCTQCNRSFGDSSHLKRHLLSHSGEKPFVCASCGKAYADSHTLKDHMQVHTGIRSFICEVCGKAFFSAKTLKEHARSHSDQRPFQCSQCPAAYKHLSGLISHRRLHSGLRPFICGECSKTFKDYTCYKRHLLTHSHHKPHVCQQCGKAYKDLKNLRHHQAQLHGNNIS